MFFFADDSIMDLGLLCGTVSICKGRGWRGILGISFPSFVGTSNATFGSNPESICRILSMDSERPWQSYHTVFTNAKAGMDGVDKEKVQKVVYEMSKGSKYFEHEQRKEAVILQRSQHMQAQAALLTEEELANYEKIADMTIAALEAGRNLSRIWMHVDLDAFYAAVETLEDPSLSGKPMAVGGMSMICTANYEARKFGIRAAMPGFIASKLCQDLIFVPPNFQRYTEYSEKVRKVLREYDPHFIARSLDEAYLDITEQCTLRNMASEAIAEELRNRVHEQTGLTCSAGVGPNRMIAKVCSDINKPNGQYVVPNQREAVMAFVSTLPIRKVSGIGKVMERLLKEICHVSVCEDLIRQRALIVALFSSLSSDFFMSVGLGIGGSDTPLEEARKSLSCERTFTAISDEEKLFAKLEELAESLSKDMTVEGLQGRTLTLKLKTTHFEVRTRSITLPHFVHKKEDLVLHASKLLKAELPISLRLMGLRISNFHGESVDPNQRTLADFFVKPAGDMKIFGDQNPTQQSEMKMINTSAKDLLCSTSTAVNSENVPQSSDTPSISTSDWRVLASEIDVAANSSMVECSETTSSCKASSENEMRWIDDCCSICKLEIPSCFTSERVEHMDFHFAEMLQQEYSSLPENPKIAQKSKRLHSVKTDKESAPPKRGRVQRGENLKENTSSLPIDVFFSKA